MNDKAFQALLEDINHNRSTCGLPDWSKKNLQDQIKDDPEFWNAWSERLLKQKEAKKVRTQNVRTNKVIERMWAMGMPTNDDRYANILRALFKVGLTEEQAFALVRDSYHAAMRNSFNLTKGSPIYEATRRRNAEEFPSGKDAEDLKSEQEGRPSRWGTPGFQRGG